MLDIMVPFYSSGWKNKKKPKSDYDNMITFQAELSGLINDALHRYKYSGLPDTAPQRLIEMNFLFRAWAGLADVDGVKLALMFSPDGKLNINGDPAGAYGYGFNGFNKHFNVYIPGADSDVMTKTAAGYDYNVKPDAVIARANDLAYPEIFILVQAAERISDAMRTMDVIAQASKSPLIITCDDRQAEEVKRVLNAVDDNAYKIVGLGAMPFDTFKVFDTGAKPENLLTLWEYRENIINEAREKLGIISNPAAKKRERLIVDEVNANNQQTMINLDKGLEARQKFCENINKLWGLNVSVEINFDVGEDQSLIEKPEEKEQEENKDETTGSEQ